MGKGDVFFSKLIDFAEGSREERKSGHLGTHEN